MVGAVPRTVARVARETTTLVARRDAHGSFDHELIALLAMRADQLGVYSGQAAPSFGSAARRRSSKFVVRTLSA